MTQATDFSFAPLLDARSSALFLDFDGTLVELAPEPDAIVIPPDLVPLLAGLRERLGGALAVVSGRAVGDRIDIPVLGCGRRQLRPLPGQHIHHARRNVAHRDGFGQGHGRQGMPV